MKKGLTELVFILDRSGSMHGLEHDTIGGFNSMLEKQKKQAVEEAGQVEVTTVLFDDKYERIHDRFPIDAVKPLTGKEYYVRGCTALLDAVGRTIDHLKNVQDHLPEDYRAEKVIFVITTDGLENSSREYSYARLKQMIGQQKELGWDFIFLGANIDAVAEAGKFGIGADRAVEFVNDSEGVALNYKVVSETISQMRMAPSCASVGSSWKSEIEENVAERQRRAGTQPEKAGKNQPEKDERVPDGKNQAETERPKRRWLWKKL